MPNIKLQSSDGEVFEVDVEIAKKSGVIKTMLEVLGEYEVEDEVVPLPNVNAAILKKVIEWVTYHRDDPPSTPKDDKNKENEISDWEADYFNVDEEFFYKIIGAAYYLKTQFELRVPKDLSMIEITTAYVWMKNLLDVASKFFTNVIEGNTEKEIPKYIRKILLPSKKKKEQLPNIKLQNSDGEVFEVDVEIEGFGPFKTMLEDLDKKMKKDDEEEDKVPIPYSESRPWIKIFKWIERKAELLPPEDDENKENDIYSWDRVFFKVDQGTLFDIILAANYLDIKGLLDATCKTVVNLFKEKTPDEIRRTFNIDNEEGPMNEITFEGEFVHLYNLFSHPCFNNHRKIN